MPCVNGCRIPICKSCIFPVGPILPISSQRKYGMGLIFGACEIPLCVHCPIFFSSLFSTFISCASRPSPTYGRFYRQRLLCVHLPAGVCFFLHYAPLRYLGPWRLFHIFPVPAVISSGRFIQLYLPYRYEFLNPPGLDSVFFFSLGRKDGGCWSVLGLLLSCSL